MGVMGTVIGASIVAALARLLADDCKAWSPRIVDRLMNRALSKLPECYRSRLEEEWQAHLREAPGDIAKVVEVINYNWAARTLSLGERRKLRRIAAYETALRRIEGVVADKHFASIPSPFKVLALGVYRERAKHNPDAAEMTLVELEKHSHRLADQLRGEIVPCLVTFATTIVHSLKDVPRQLEAGELKVPGTSRSPLAGSFLKTTSLPSFRPAPLNSCPRLS